MVGLESSMEQAQTALKIKKPKVTEAEKKRQEKFMAMLRARRAPQPKGAKVAPKAKAKVAPKAKKAAKKKTMKAAKKKTKRTAKKTAKKRRR